MIEVACPPVQFGPYQFDAATGALSRNGRRIALRPQAEQVLAYLLARPLQVVSREELYSKLWAAGTYVDAEHGLNLCIHEIRASLHDDAGSPKYIETLPRRGYRFIGSVGAVPPASSAGSGEAPLETQNSRTEMRDAAPRGPRGMRALAIAASVVVVAAILIVAGRKGVRDTAAGLPSRPPVTAVALLPLSDLSGRPGEEWFVEGVTWELQQHLESVDSLRVTSLRSMLPHRGSRKYGEIARTVDVSHLVSGSVASSPERMTLSLKVVDARTGEAVWARRFETTLGELPRTESEAANAIALALARTAPAMASQHRAPEQVSAEAHTVLLKAMRAATAEEYTRGLERATEIDPRFALAWSLLADAYVSDTWFAQTMPPAVGYEKAKEYALRALAIDPSDSSAHTSIAAVKLHHEWDWPAAEAEFKRAIALSPSDAFAHHIYSHYLLTMDRLAESVAESRIASDLDPLNPTLSTCVGWHCLYARQYDDAIAECMKLIHDDKASAVTYYYLGRVYVRQGKLDDGIAALEIAEKKAGGLNAVVSTLAYAYGRAARRTDAHRALTVLEKRAAAGRYVAAFDMAIVYAGLGDRDATFEWLERAFLERSTWLVHLKWDDRFAEVRTDPRFVTLLKRMGIPNPTSVLAPESAPPQRYSRIAAAK